MKRFSAILAIAVLAACEPATQDSQQQVINVPVPNAEGTPGAATRPMVVQQPAAQHGSSGWLWGLGGYLLGRNHGGGGYYSGSREVHHYHSSQPSRSSSSPTRSYSPPKAYSAPSYSRPSFSRPSSPSFSRPSYSRPSFGRRR